MQQQYSIIIVDDHQLFADGLLRILEDEKDFVVTGICNNGQELNHLLNDQQPDLVMLDIQMAGINGLDACQKIKQSRPEIKVILISMFESPNVINEGKKAGANGYIPKTTDAALVKTSIREVLDGQDVFLKPNRPENLFDTGNSTDKLLISKREREIIELIKKGYTSKMTAEALHISQYTVETHRKNIMKKLKVGSIKELIAYAYENNL